MVRVLLRFSREIVNNPITSTVILEEKTPINIISARMNQLGGEILAEIEGPKTDKVIKAFRDRGVIVDVNEVIEKDDDKCIDCGGCVSICPSEALSFQKDYSVKLNPEQCNGVTCGLCIDACVRNALQLVG